MEFWLFSFISSFLISLSVADRLCIGSGGSCEIWPTLRCPGGWESNDLCNGGGNRRCCLGCGSECIAQEATDSANDQACNSARGTCQHNSNYCNGIYAPGMCGGEPRRQCCDPKSSLAQDCPLVISESTENVYGLNDVPIRIHPDFVDALNMTDQAAQLCNVEILVVHSFRKRQPGQGISIVTQVVRRSNHLAGHAITLYAIKTQDELCRGRCIQDGQNSDANCFIDLIKEAGLRWGGNFSPPDPTHIDDGFSLNPTEWKKRVQNLQTNC